MIRLALLMGYNLLRWTARRLASRGRLRADALERISPHAAVKRYGDASIVLGRNLDIASGCELLASGTGCLKVGDGTYMNRYCMISCQNSVSIGQGCMFGPGVKIFDNNHRFSRAGGVSSQLSAAAIEIGDRCWLASDVVVLKGTTIGEGSVIGAGCVVSGNIPPHSLVRAVAPTYSIENIR
ncbi:MAG: acyltransferase [Bacteroides sp.]|nr:acyltransferase [Bacteroides sp.]MCM1094724.1 acyltransferase [Terasakiella sp.]